MSEPFDADAIIAATAPAVGLTIDHAHRPGVERFLAIAAQMASTLDAVELDERENALAPVFTLPEDDA